MGFQSLSQMTAIPHKFGQGIHVEILTTGNATRSQSLCVRELITGPTEHDILTFLLEGARNGNGRNLTWYGS